MQSFRRVVKGRTASTRTTWPQRGVCCWHFFTDEKVCRRFCNLGRTWVWYFLESFDIKCGCRRPCIESLRFVSLFWRLSQVPSCLRNHRYARSDAGDQISSWRCMASGSQVATSWAWPTQGRSSCNCYSSSCYDRSVMGRLQMVSSSAAWFLCNVAPRGVDSPLPAWSCFSQWCGEWYGMHVHPPSKSQDCEICSKTACSNWWLSSDSFSWSSLW